MSIKVDAVYGRIRGFEHQTLRDATDLYDNWWGGSWPFEMK